MYLRCTKWVNAGYIVYFLAMYLQCTGSVHHPLPPVSDKDLGATAKAIDSLQCSRPMFIKWNDIAAHLNRRPPVQVYSLCLQLTELTSQMVPSVITTGSALYRLSLHCHKTCTYIPTHSPEKIANTPKQSGLGCFVAHTGIVHPERKGSLAEMERCRIY